MKRQYQLVIYRLFISGFIFLETLLIPLILNSSNYAELELLKNIAIFSPLCIIGFTGGSQFLFFRGHSKLFEQIFPCYLLSSLLLSILCSIYFKQTILVFICLMYCLIIFNEQVLKVNELYFKSLLGRPLLSLFILILGYFFRHNLKVLVFFSFLLTAIIIFILNKKFHFTNFKFNWKLFFDVLGKGFFLSVSTCLFSLIFLSERYFISENFSLVESDYALLVSISSMVLLVLTTLNYYYSIQVGKNFDSITKLNLSSMFLISLFVSSILILLCAFCLPYINIYLYADFNLDLNIFLALIIPKALFFSVGSITPFLLYKERLIIPSILICIIVVFQQLCYYFLEFDDSLAYIVFIGSLLSLYSLYTLKYTLSLTNE